MHVRNAPDRLLRWERRMDLPLFVGSLLFLACYAVHVLLRDIAPLWHDLALGLALLIWVVFLLDYAVRILLSGEGARFVRTHWLDTVVLVLPLLRPVRIVNTYLAVRRRRDRPRLSLYGRVITYAAMTAVLLSFVAALAVYEQERGAPGATIRTFGDAVWWACAAITTVGYGDATPVTPLGRVYAVFLMACGVALLGAVTGAFSSWLIQVFAREDKEDKEEGVGEGDEDEVGEGDKERKAKPPGD
ncbi:potassium channel family protein [Streptomyces sp. NPDC059479]|uniref:potassium channel family protein n=1 Tax=Streptomyces sp. NPDC059479 TaxID=3346848 RepID=UPI0036C4E623